MEKWLPCAVEGVGAGRKSGTGLGSSQGLVAAAQGHRLDVGALLGLCPLGPAWPGQLPVSSAVLSLAFSSFSKEIPPFLPLAMADSGSL